MMEYTRGLLVMEIEERMGERGRERERERNEVVGRRWNGVTLHTLPSTLISL